MGIDVGEQGKPAILTGDEIEEWLVGANKGDRQKIRTLSSVNLQEV
jgi:hypothetical protein